MFELSGRYKFFLELHFFGHQYPFRVYYFTLLFDDDDDDDDDDDVVVVDDDDDNNNNNNNNNNMYFLYVCSLGIYTGTMELTNSNYTYPMR